MVGLLGTGYIADWRAQALRAVPGATLDAVCDKDPTPAHSFAKRDGVGRVSELLEAMLEGPGLDAVQVLLPPEHQCRAAAVVDSGRHVLLEKLMGISPEEFAIAALPGKSRMLQMIDRTATAQEDVLPTIDLPYLLAVNIPCFIRADGRRVVDQLWHKDLIEHLRYLPHLTLASPLSNDPPPEGAVELPDSEGRPRLHHVDLRNPRSFFNALLGLPIDLSRLWKAVGRTQIVHSGVAGWPIPVGWLLVPIARLRRRYLVLIVESAPWRIPPGDLGYASLLRRLHAAVSERLARYCVKAADLALFTHTQYRDSLLKPDPGHGHVISASWIDESVIISDDEAARLWQTRLSAQSQPLKLVFVGRITAAKGIPVLLEAMRLLDGQSVRVDLEIFGAGDLQKDCEQLAASLHGPVTTRMRGTLLYGQSFFQALHLYHALVVPSLSDEQPRIVYDAMSQALPPIASATAGLRECVAHESNGLLVPPGDPKALAAVIRQVASEPDQLRRLGMAGLSLARGLTHQEMHRRRAFILREELKSRLTQHAPDPV
jgi:glycosyltransferase involved in cell wall biosynthesis